MDAKFKRTAKLIAMKENKGLRLAIEKIVEHYFEDEKKHYNESTAQEKKNHIFNFLNFLKNTITQKDETDKNNH